MEKGFYIAGEESEAFGFSIALVYIKDEKDLQLSIMIGNYNIAIGYIF